MPTNRRRQKEGKQPEISFLKELRNGVRGLTVMQRPSSLKKAKHVGDEIESALNELRSLRDKFDPVLAPHAMLDPTNPLMIGNFIGIALLAQPKLPLESIKPFHGSGVYAIYYNGAFPSYKPLTCSDQPIYIGGAASADALATTPREQGKKLHKRLTEHIKSIRQARNLRLRDFDCRYLVVHTGWEASAEKFLIKTFAPVWNDSTNVCYGIGKHGDKKKRSNSRSPWDTLHPGRPWAMAKKLGNQKTKAKIMHELKDYFQGHRPLRDRKSIMRKFFDDLRQWKFPRVGGR